MVALIFQYIATHWIEWLFAAISGALFAAYRGLSKRLKTEVVKNQAINAAVLALLHDRLYQACQFYISRGYVRWETGTTWSTCLNRTKLWVAMELERNFITDVWPWNMGQQKERIKI